MEVELKSDWQEVQVELLKNLHGYKLKDVNDDATWTTSPRERATTGSC